MAGALAHEHGKKGPGAGRAARLPGAAVPRLQAQAPPYRDSKLRRRGPGGPAAGMGHMEAAAAAIARRFGLHAAGRAVATKLASVAPFLFMFVNRPGVDPTNNESERMLREVVTARKVRFRIASLEGAGMFSNIMTCVLTWRKRNLTEPPLYL